jgi:MerR family transcriptional regulator, redox-sensitive transcriptional activator SoxR
VDSFDWHEAGLTVSQVSERSGVAPSALRFYERKGLITSDRTAGNQRRYRADVLCRVAMIRACQRAGLSIAEIRDALADLPAGRVPGPDDWDRLSRQLKRELHNRIEDLNLLLDDLSRSATAAPVRPGPGADAQVTPARHRAGSYQAVQP